MAFEVNQVWNACNAHQIEVLKREGRFLSGFDFAPFVRAASVEFDYIGSTTIDEVSQEYAAKRKAAKKPRLCWRKSGGKRRSLGWVPFKARGAKWKGGAIRFAGIDFPSRRVRRGCTPALVLHRRRRRRRQAGSRTRRRCGRHRPRPEERCHVLGRDAAQCRVRLVRSALRSCCWPSCLILRGVLVSPILCPSLYRVRHSVRACGVRPCRAARLWRLFPARAPVLTKFSSVVSSRITCSIVRTARPRDAASLPLTSPRT